MAQRLMSTGENVTESLLKNVFSRVQCANECEHSNLADIT